MKRSLAAYSNFYMPNAGREMTGKDAGKFNPMNRNTHVDGSKKVVGGELILEFDPSSPKGVCRYYLEFKDDLAEVPKKPNQESDVPFSAPWNDTGIDSDVPEQAPEKELNEELESLAPRNYCSDNDEPQKDPEQGISAQIKIDSLEELFAPYLFHNRDVPELIKRRIGNMSEEFGSESSSHISYQSFPNDKEKLWKLKVFEPSNVQGFQLRKKCRCEDLTKPESTSEDASEELTGERASKAIIKSKESISKQKERAGAGKRRCTQWVLENDFTTGEVVGTSKRRKARWDFDDSQLKMLGPIHLPDFMRESTEFELDPEVKRLKMELMEINRELKSSELHDDRPEERSPSPETVYNLGIRRHTLEVRMQKKLERAGIICMLVKKNPTFKTPPKPMPNKFFKKIYMPVKEYPTYNFIGLLIGPRGNTQKNMEKETGAKISLRGKGSAKRPGPFDNDDLHVYVEADNQKSLDAAVVMVEKLLIPVADRKNEHKRAQLAELAKLNGTYGGENSICREQRHRKSTFKGISCGSCGSFCHLESHCPLSTSSQICQPSWSSSEVQFGLTQYIERHSVGRIDSTKLYVGFLSQTMGSKGLKELFLPFGKINEAKVIKDQSTGLSKGYGFVKFEDPIDAAAAVAHLNGYTMDGTVLVVRVAMHKDLAAHFPLSSQDLSSEPMASVPGSLFTCTSGNDVATISTRLRQ